MPPRKSNLRAVNPRQASAPRATIAETRVKATQLFRMVARGYTVTDAGKELGMTEPQASKLYNEELSRTMEGDLALRQNQLANELETLRQLKLVFMEKALDGNEKAARVILGVVDRIANLCGLNAELKIQISNQRIDETVSQVLSLIEDRSSQVPALLEAGVLQLDPAIVDGEFVEAGEAG